MEGKRLLFEDPKPEWCSAPIALEVGRGSQRRVLYVSRELLMLHSPVFERMLAEGNGFRESEPNAVLELLDDDPEEFDELLRLIGRDYDTEFGRVLCKLVFSHFEIEFHRGPRLASKYLMEDAIRYVDYHASEGRYDTAYLSPLIRSIDSASLPRTRALVFRTVCTEQQLDELRKRSFWRELSETLRLELAEHYYDDQKKANGRKGFCSIAVPEIQWSNTLTFESPAPEHCGGVASLRLIVGQGEEKRVLHCSKELIYSLFPSLREKLRNGGGSLELEDDSADDFVHYMNWELLKRPWSAFSVHQQSAILCLGGKYQSGSYIRGIIEHSWRFTLCHKLYLAEQCHLNGLQKKYADEIFESVAKLDEARKSEWWLKLSDKLQLALMNRIIQKIDLSMIRL